MKSASLDKYVTHQDLIEFGERLKTELKIELGSEFRTELHNNKNELFTELYKHKEEFFMELNKVGIIVEDMRDNLKMALEWMYPKSEKIDNHEVRISSLEHDLSILKLTVQKR